MYRKLDVFLAKLKKLVRQRFNVMGLRGFDELNVIRAMRLVNELYSDLDDFNTEEYRGLALYGREYAQKYLTDEEKERLKRKRFDPDDLVGMVLSGYDPVTGYVYKHETDRKRARLGESIIASAYSHNRKGYMSNLKRSADLWYTQSMQYGINITGEAVKRAYEDAGIKRVRWVAKHDGRQCEECEELDGKVFPIEEVPPRPHIGCRCQLVPER